MVKIVYYVSGS